MYYRKKMHGAIIFLLSSSLLFSVAQTLFGQTSSTPKAVLNSAIERGELSVVDSRQKKVGEIVGFSGISMPETPIVMFDIVYDKHYLFVVSISKNHFKTPYTLFESSDCTGTPYLPYVESPMPLVGITPPGHTVYIQDSDTVTTISSQSARVTVTDHPSLSWGDCQATNFGRQKVVPAKKLIDLDTEFRPPFSVVKKGNSN